MIVFLFNFKFFSQHQRVQHLWGQAEGPPRRQLQLPGLQPGAPSGREKLLQQLQQGVGIPEQALGVCGGFILMTLQVLKCKFCQMLQLNRF